MATELITMMTRRTFLNAAALATLSPAEMADAQETSKETPIPVAGDRYLSSAASEVVRATSTLGVWLGCSIGRVSYFGAAGYSDLEAKRPPNAEDRLMWASISKPITAVVAASAMAEHNISFDFTPISQLPELKEVALADYQAITMEQLFRHQHNLPRDFIKQSLEGKDLTQLRQDRIKELLQQPPRPNPNRISQYSNTGYALLAYAMERMTRTSWDALWQDFLWKRMRLTSFGMGKPGTESPTPSQYWNDPKGVHKAGPDYRDIWRWQPSGGFHSTMRDILHFGAAFCDALNGVQGSAISPALAQTLAGNKDPMILGPGDWPGLPVLACNGSLNSEKCSLLLIPKRRWVLVWYCNSGSDHDELREDWLVASYYKAALLRGGIRTDTPCDVRLTGVTFLDETFKEPLTSIAPDKDIHLRINFSIAGSSINDFYARITIGNSIASPIFLNGMDPGNHQFSMRLVNPGPGTHRITVELDPLRLINDVDRSNNVYRSTVTVRT